MTKDEARCYIKQQKQLMAIDEISIRSESVINNLIHLPEYKSARTILTYVSYNQEVETKTFIEASLSEGKRVLVPKVYGKEMLFHKISSLEELKKGKFGILEPDNDNVQEPIEGLMIMPGLAFDLQFDRAGYGGGFYDKYLEKHKKLMKVAVCFDFQIVDSIETKEYDLKPDIIVTESKVYRNEGTIWNH